jgi:integrase
VLSAGTVNGKRRRQAFYGRTEKEVRDKLHDARQALKAGKTAKTRRLTTGKWLEDWLGMVDPDRSRGTDLTVRPATYRSYEQLARVHLIPALGSIPLEKLSAADVRGLLSAKADAVSAQTVLHIRAVLRNSLNVAMESDLISRNPAIGRRRRGQSPRLKSPNAATSLTTDEVPRLLNAIRGQRLEALYSIALALGLRQGEVLGLRWADIDLEAGGLTVRRALQRVHGKYQLVEPKSETSKRTIAPLPAIIVSNLREHMTRRDVERDALGARWLNSWDLVFTTPHGAPLHGTQVTKEFQGICERAGLRRLRFHDLRHSCASILQRWHVPLSDVQALLGHSHPSLTQATYTHALSQERAATAMDEVFGGK